MQRLYGVLFGFFFLLQLLSCRSPEKLQREPAQDINKDLRATAPRAPIIYQLPLINSADLDGLPFYFVDLRSLRNQKVKIDEIKGKSSLLEQYLEQFKKELQSLSKEKDLNLNFKGDGFDVRLDEDDFKRLHQFLNLIDQSALTDLQRRHLVSVVLASFRQKMIPPIEFIPDLVTMPIKGLQAISSYQFVVDDRPMQNEAISQSLMEDRTAESMNQLFAEEKKLARKLGQEVCDYTGPKKGSGVHLGFKIKCGEEKYKLKLAEENSAPLNSRIYRRVGYHVPVISHLNRIQVNYKREIFLELHSGKRNPMPIKAFGKTVFEISAGRHTDIDRHLFGALTEAGEFISKKDFLQKLWPHCKSLSDKCFLENKFYDSDFERTIKQVLFENVAVEKDSPEHEFGSWGYDDLNHSQWTEVKALVLLGAFTGNNDLRKDNNKLAWDRRSGKIIYKISDPGTGYGSGGMFAPTRINEMAWEILRPARKLESGSGDDYQDFIEVINYRSNSNHKAFHNLRYTEAQWIGRRIAEISFEDLTQDIIDSGFSAAEVMVLREILRARQKNIVIQLGLQADFPELMKIEPQRKVQFQAKGENFEFSWGEGRSAQIPTRGVSAVNGRLVLNGQPYRGFNLNDGK
jgi:hypothetical protein